MAIKYCWATNRRGSSLKGVMKLKEIGHDQSPVRVTLLGRQKNAVVCKTEREPELCDGWIIPGRQVNPHLWVLANEEGYVLAVAINALST